MKHSFIIHEDAAKDAVLAYSFYESKQTGLGEKFFKRVEDCYKKIDLNPEAYQKVYISFRAAGLKKIPFQIVYEITKPKTITVYSIFNTHKNPASKFTR